MGPSAQRSAQACQDRPQSASQRRQDTGDVPHHGVPELRRPGILTHTANLRRQTVPEIREIREQAAMRRPECANEEMRQKAGSVGTHGSLKKLMIM